MKHFMFEDKDYVINPQYKPKRDNTLGVMIALYAIHKFSGKSSRKVKRSYTAGWGRAEGPKFIDRRQNCVAKMHYSKSMAAHKWQIQKYIKREDAGIGGKSPVLFGSVTEEEYKRKMVAKNYRIFLSPGKDGVSLETLTKTFMNKLETETGFKFIWLGAEHHNTAHPHAHIVINGVDAAGRDVWLNPSLVKTLHEYARDICTSLQGERTAAEIRDDNEKALDANRFIWIDKLIDRYISTDGTLNPNMQAFELKRDKIKKRADHISKLGLCRYEEGSYKFDKNWKETLQTLGRYNMYLDAKKNLQYTHESRFQLYEYTKGVVYGKVTKIYKTDEVSDNYAAVLESVDGNAYFIPFFHRPKIKAGETIKITPVKGQSGRLQPYIDHVTSKDMLAALIDNGTQPMGYGTSI